jgi:hypothetical protein
VEIPAKQLKRKKRKNNLLYLLKKRIGKLVGVGGLLKLTILK